MEAFYALALTLGVASKKAAGVAEVHLFDSKKSAERVQPRFQERVWSSFFLLDIRVMRVGSDTFGDPIFQKGLQN